MISFIIIVIILLLLFTTIIIANNKKHIQKVIDRTRQQNQAETKSGDIIVSTTLDYERETIFSHHIYLEKLYEHYDVLSISDYKECMRYLIQWTYHLSHAYAASPDRICSSDFDYIVLSDDCKYIVKIIKQTRTVDNNKILKLIEEQKKYFSYCSIIIISDNKVSDEAKRTADYNHVDIWEGEILKDKIKAAFESNRIALKEINKKYDELKAKNDI